MYLIINSEVVFILERVAVFSKVSFEEFKKAFANGPVVDQDRIKDMYENIKIPVRATARSGGYDFYSPYYIKLEPDETALVPTGIHARIDDGWTLDIYPRSGLGFKFKVRLANTVGIIDADYFDSDNEGHIFVMLSNEGDSTVTIDAGERFVQGKFVPFGITKDDDATGGRNGGMGSTGRL